MEKFQFVDSVVCAGAIISSGLIGLGYAVWSKGPDSGDTAAAYLMGGRQMKLFPIAMSLIAGLFSGLTLQGISGQVYALGISHLFAFPTQLINVFINVYITLPVFYDLKLTCINEYLERRFDKRVRHLSSAFMVLTAIVSSTTSLHLAVLDFKQVSGVDTLTIKAIISVVCGVYTVLGGFKAVVWADTVQVFVILAGLLVLIVKGTADIGGLGTLWERCLNGGRLDLPSPKPDLSILHTYWSTLIGAAILRTPSYTLNQDTVQRYLALPRLLHAKIAAIMFSVGMLFMFNITSYLGLLVYATFHDCDPLTTGQVQAADQLLMLLAIRVLSGYPALPGLFAAAVLSTCMSTLSTGLNSAAMVIYEDFAKPSLPRDISSRKIGILIKSMVGAIAIICFGLTFIFERVKLVHQLTLSLSSMTFGPILGLFMGGLLLPWINKQGAFYGGVVGFCFAATMVLGAQYVVISGQIRLITKPKSVEGCQTFYNVSTASGVSSGQYESYVFPLFTISFLWYTLFGAIVTIFAEIIVSFFTGFADLHVLDRRLVAPLARKLLPEPENQEEKIPMKQYERE